MFQSRWIGNSERTCGSVSNLDNEPSTDRYRRKRQGLGAVLDDKQLSPNTPDQRSWALGVLPGRLGVAMFNAFGVTEKKNIAIAQTTIPM